MNKLEQVHDSWKRLIDYRIEMLEKDIKSFDSGNELFEKMIEKVQELKELSEKVNPQTFYCIKEDERVLDFFRHIGRMDLWKESYEQDYQIDNGDILFNDPQRETGVTMEKSGWVVIFEDI
jgi:hypothetical protein